jgi:hypothetical protein
MKTTDYEKLIERIDNKLKQGSFKFKHKEYIEENNVFTGKSYKQVWKESIAVERKEQMIIDDKGVSYSILKDEVII